MHVRIRAMESVNKDLRERLRREHLNYLLFRDFLPVLSAYKSLQGF